MKSHVVDLCKSTGDEYNAEKPLLEIENPYYHVVCNAQ